MKKMRLLCLFAVIGIFQSSTYAQVSAVVSGTVKNESGAPLNGATVFIKNSNKGTRSAKGGTFTLSADANDSLLISFVGYEDVVVKAQANLNVVLHPSANSQDVVVIGYGTVRKKEVTGSITTVTSKDFDPGVITTPEQLISGKVAGVSITSNGGAPGSGSVIRIRGEVSLSASNDPLIVIDGVPLSGNGISGASNTLSLINPNDIATFTILKDAAATAIYGSRASNGVILITTKKGTSGKPVINFSSQVSSASLVKEISVLSANDFRQYVDSLGTGLFGAVPFKSLLGKANTDWQKEIYHTAIATDNNLSIAGAYKKIPFRISGGYLNQDGILRTDNLQRVSAGITLSPSLFTNHLKIDINLKGAVTNTRFANGGAVGSAVYYDPTQPVYDPTSQFGGYNEWYSAAGNGVQTLNKLAPRNPVGLLNLYSNTSVVKRSYGNIQFDYKFHWIPELHVNLNLGYDVADGAGKQNVPAYAAQNFLDSGQMNKYHNKIGNSVAEFYLNYNKTIPGIKSNINATAGYGYYNNLTTNYNFTSYRANGDSVPGSTPKFALDKLENTLISYYGRLIYTYNEKYVVAASIRTDGSSRFSAANRWGVFPSVAATWRINQENFLKDKKSLSDLKLRLSYGVTGNQDGINRYSYLGVYSLGDNTSRVQFGNTFYNQGTPAAYDANIKWEQTAAYNAGLDFGFFKNRLTGSVDAYYKKTKDLLNNIPIPAGSNFNAYITTNVGNLTNKGVEVTLGGTPIKTKHFVWDVNFNVAYNSSMITNLTATKDSTFQGNLVPGTTVQINSVGYTPKSFYVYHQEYDKNGKPVEGVYADVNGDGIINTNDLYRYKSPFPKFIFGFTTQFTYDKWSLSTVLRANLGNYMYNGVASGAEQSNIFNPLGYLANVSSEIKKSNFYYSQGSSDYFVQNASFLKMDNLSVAYNAGRILNGKVGLRVNATCQNVFTVTKYTGIDPEIYGGIDNALYPRPRTFVLGVNLSY